MLISEPPREKTSFAHIVISAISTSMHYWIESMFFDRSFDDRANEIIAASEEAELDSKSMAVLMTEVHPMILPFQIEEDSIARMRNHLVNSSML